MPDANVNLKITGDNSGFQAAGKEAVGVAQQTGQSIESVNRKLRAGTQAAQQIYKDEILLLRLQSTGHKGVADALKLQLDQRKQALKIAREQQISEGEALKLVRQRAAAEKQLAATQGAANARQALPAMNRVQSSVTSRVAGGAASGSRGAGARGSAGYDASVAYQVLQDGIQGGLTMGAVGVAQGTANNVPQVLGLIAKYKSAISFATSAIAGVGTGITAGYAIADWKEFSKVVGGLLTNFEEELKLSTEWQNAQRKRLNNFNRARAVEQSTETGAAQGGNAENLAKAQALGIESRAATEALANQGRDRQLELERLKIEGIQDEARKAQALRDLDKSWILEKAERAKRSADYEYERAAQTRAEAKAAIDTLEAAAKAAKLSAGASGTSPELERIKAARPGLEGRLNSADQTLRGASAAKVGADSGMSDARSQVAIIDQKFKNETTERETKTRQDKATKEAAEEKKEAAKAEEISKASVRHFWKSVNESFRQAADRARTDQDIQVLELRSRGQNKAADKLEKKNSVDRRAQELVTTQDRKPEDARRAAEQEYDLKNPNGRIRGAGYGGRGKNPKRTDFTGIDGVDYTGANGDGGLNNQSYKGANSNGGLDGQNWKGANGTGGLDGLGEMQKKNHQIRGAGFKGEKPAPDKDGGGNKPDAGVQGGGVIGMVIGLLSSMNRKLDGIQPGRQPSRR